MSHLDFSGLISPSLLCQNTTNGNFPAPTVELLVDSRKVIKRGNQTATQRCRFMEHSGHL